MIGRLTKDPDMRYTSNGTAVATFTLAVNRNFTNQNGSREADFINCVIWRKSAESLANYCRKGTLLGVTGRIQTRNYENQQGQRIYVTEVVAERYQLLESRQVNENRTIGSQKDPLSNSTSNDLSNQEPPKERFDSSHIDISNDDLPF